MPAVAPTRVLDGFGAFTPPPPTAKPIASNFRDRADAEHPPGFYGPAEGLVAVNTLAPDDRPLPLDVSPLNARLDVYRHGEPIDLRGPVFVAALTLLMIDALVVIALSGALSAMRTRRRAAGLLLIAGLAALLASPLPSRAQSKPAAPPQLTQQQC